jgi:hypothetical protein
MQSRHVQCAPNPSKPLKALTVQALRRTRRGVDAAQAVDVLSHNTHSAPAPMRNDLRIDRPVLPAPSGLFGLRWGHQFSLRPGADTSAAYLGGTQFPNSSARARFRNRARAFRSFPLLCGRPDFAVRRQLRRAVTLLHRSKNVSKKRESFE